MRGRLILLALALSIPLTFYVSSGSGAPDPVNCTGYPEPRIYLEDQSWWTPQSTNPADPSHPGTGKVGHIHVGMCYPLYQTISGTTLHLDITVKLHDMPGTPGRLIVQAYGDAGGPDGPLVPRCLTSDCTYTYGYDFPLSVLNYSGWRTFMAFLPVNNADTSKQYPVPRWQVNFNVPKPPAPVGSTGSVLENLGGDSWYRAGGSAYARVDILRQDVPWNETTGNLTPLVGTWNPTVTYTRPGEFAYVDPAFHNVPPSKGIIVWEGTNPNGLGIDTRVLSIDTTALSNGIHKLVLGSSNDQPGTVGPSGTNTGVLVVPFLVHNLICHY